MEKKDSKISVSVVAMAIVIVLIVAALAVAIVAIGKAIKTTADSAATEVGGINTGLN